MFYVWLKFLQHSKKPSDVRFKNKIQSIFWHSTHEKLEIPISSIEVVESVCVLGVGHPLNTAENKVLYCKQRSTVKDSCKFT